MEKMVYCEACQSEFQLRSLKLHLTGSRHNKNVIYYKNKLEKIDRLKTDFVMCKKCGQKYLRSRKESHQKYDCINQDSTDDQKI